MYKLLILTFLLSYATTGFAQLTLTKRSDVSSNVYLHHINFASDNIHGYAVGSGGSLWSTKDGGITWSSQSSPVSSTLLACYLTSSQEAWAVGADGVILRTINGSTWDTLPGQSGRNETFYDIIWHNGVGHIIGTCGARYQYNGTLWQQQTTHTQESYLKFFINESNLFGLLSNNKINQIGVDVDLGIPDAIHVTDMATFDDRLYFLDQEGNKIIIIENNNVTNISTPSNTISNIYVMNDSTFILGGKAGECFVTQNGGSTWTNHSSSNIKGHITAFHQIADDKVLFTTSMGEIWELKICARQYSTTSISSCYDEPITIGGVSYVNVDTVVTDTLVSINACDSIVTYALSFSPQSPLFTQVSPICEGKPFTLPNTSLNGISGTWSPSINNIMTTTYIFSPDLTLFPCASTITMIVIVNPGDDATFNISNFCAPTSGVAFGIINLGGTFSFDPAPGDGAVINPFTGVISNAVNGTTYSIRYKTSGICPDEQISTVMAINGVPMSTIDTTICNDGALTIGSEIFTINRPSGQVVLPAASSFGCDSTITVNVSFFPTTKQDTFQIISCPESPYLWPLNGKIYPNPGTYNAALTDNNGCPYTNTLELSHHSVATSIIDTTICNDSEFTIGSEIFDFNRPTGQVVLPEASSYGCDSTIQIKLSFFPCDTTNCDFVLEKDSLAVQKNQTTFYNVLNNDQLPSSFTWNITKVSKEKNISYEYDDKGEITFTISGDFSEPIIVSYEVCTEDCECKSSTFTIQNEALEDITLTNVFIPNSSGKNSTLRFTNENESLQDTELWIFNRNGDRIFYMKDYDNSWNADGFPGGIYYYVLKARGETIKKTLAIFK